jgi:hypothetical protein
MSWVSTIFFKRFNQEKDTIFFSHFLRVIAEGLKLVTTPIRQLEGTRDDCAVCLPSAH